MALQAREIAWKCANVLKYIVTFVNHIEIKSSVSLKLNGKKKKRF